MRHLASTCTLLLALSLLQTAASAGDIDPAKGCKRNPELVGACHWIRGRISAKNGWPEMIIWPIGTNRLLGVLPSEQELVPPEVEKLFADAMEDKYIFGNFEVCPFTKQEDGAMQFVCIESSEALVSQPKRALSR